MLNNFNSTKESYFKWFQLVRAFPKSQKLAWLDDRGNFQNIIHLNNRVIKNNQILAIEKYIPKETILLIYCSEK